MRIDGTRADLREVMSLGNSFDKSRGSSAPRSSPAFATGWPTAAPCGATFVRTPRIQAARTPGARAAVSVSAALALERLDGYHRGGRARGIAPRCREGNE